MVFKVPTHTGNRNHNRNDPKTGTASHTVPDSLLHAATTITVTPSSNTERIRRQDDSEANPPDHGCLPVMMPGSAMRCPARRQAFEPT